VIENERESARHLLAIEDLRGQRTVSLKAATYSIGRDPTNSIVLNSKRVSRQHAILLRVTIPETNTHLFRIIDGNLQGKRSTNGLTINGQRYFSYDLQHGDIINFGGMAKAKYYAISNLSDAEFLASSKAVDLSSFLSNLSNPFQTLFTSDNSLKDSSDAALGRLASFPELIPNPILEIDLTGAVTYLNPAAILKFPDIKAAGLQHPLFVGLSSTVQHHEENFFAREVEVGSEIFEQSVHYIPESDLIRSFIVDITERKRTEAALREAKEKYRSIFEHATEGIFQATPDGNYLIVNPMLADIYGYSSPAELIAAITDTGSQLDVDPNRRAEFIALIHQQDAVWGFKSQVYRKDGRVIWVSENARAIRNADGHLLGFEGTVKDITEQRRAEVELQKRDNLLQGVAEATNCLLTDVDYDAAIARALAALGLAAGVDRVYIYENHPHPITREIAMRMRHQWSRESIQPSINQAHWQHQPYTTGGISRWYNILTNGNSISGIKREFPIAEQEVLERDNILSILMVPILLGNEFWGYIAFDDCQSERQWSKNEESILFTMAANISAALQRQQTEEMIHYQAFHDLLTGLPNRMLFNDRLSLSLANAIRSNELLAVMFLDLDRFKTINDTLGHTLGDELLQCVAQRLTSCLREGDTVARWGGDEFTLLLPQVSHVTDVAKTAERILASLDSVFILEGNELYITTSIGIALYEGIDIDADTLIKHADAALYQAKEQGRNNYQFYTAAINSRAPELLTLEKSLRHGLERGEFLVYYQPQINITTWEISGMEALLRWQHPEMGLVAPKIFMSVAEESGLIIPIGEWVLRTACTQNKAWQDAGLPPISVAVNLSARQFHQPRLLEIIAQILQETGLEPRFLDLEITETTAIQNVEFTKVILHSLQEMGIRISMDDFGTGYSSLSHLKQFPLHTLKIDQSFVQDLALNGRDIEIVKAVIGLGQGLNLNVVAEGVESQEQLNFLHSLKCEEVQGYLFNRPLSVEHATAALQQADELKT
jgi:diguanylate cyclase (GGDEF)-like protein/PAS domain S-box-containing protein